MKKLITLTALLSLNTLAMDLGNYNQIINEIQDPALKKIVMEKVADKLAAQILENTNAQVQAIPANEVKEIEQVQPSFIPVEKVEVNQREVMATTSPVTNANKVETVETINLSQTSVTEAPKAQKEYEANIGLIGYANTIKEGNTKLESSGVMLAVGVAKNIDSHKFRLQLHALGMEADKLSHNGKEYETKNYDDKLEMNGMGFGGSYSYFITENFGVGAFVNYTQGIARFTASNGEFAESRIGITDAGLRMDLKVGAWNPYINLGSSTVKSDDGDTTGGASAYLGLLNFEF